MSARKRKIQVEIQRKFDAILDLLVRIKPRLNDIKRSAWDALVSDLHKVAELAEELSQERPRSNGEWISMADTLDREGVNIWNACSSIKGGADDASYEVVAAFRLAGFRLIEAGLEQNPPIETLIHVLRLASKAGASLSETGRHDTAAVVLTCAAKYEDQLKAADDPGKAHQQAKAQATILYLSSRMEAAWREGNDGVADFMLQKITESDQRLRLLRQPDREALASKLLNVGKSILRTIRGVESGSEKLQYQNAIKWLQKAFAIVESCPESEYSGSQDLKRVILKSLARGYYLSASHDPDNLDRAEASLNELIGTVETTHCSGTEQQQLRWMRMAVLKKKNVAESGLIGAFQSIIDHMSYSDSEITDILQELKTLQEQHVLVASVHRYALKKVLETGKSSSLPYVDRLLLSLLFHCSKDANHHRAMEEIDSSLALLHSAEVELSKVPTTACLTLLWQFGDRHYNAKRWAEAADWYLCGTHTIFASMARSSHAKCFRKAALCHIQQREFSTASAILRRCPGNEAASHYVALLCAVHQGLENEAIQAVQDMANAPDFDRKMLLLATQLANESDMKNLLLSVLETLLRVVRMQSKEDVHAESISLIRCVIRLVVKLMEDPSSNSVTLVNTLLGHFATAKLVIMEFHEGQRASLIGKDISWLWRTAYNCAVQGCVDWGDEEAVATLFDAAREMLELYCTSVLTEPDAELNVYRVNAAFAAAAGRVFSLRKRLENTADSARHALLISVSDHIRATHNNIESLLERCVFTTEACERVSVFVHALRVFRVEVSCYMKDWKETLAVIEDNSLSDTTRVDTLQAIADILWNEKDCPVQVLFTALETILHATLDRSSLSVEKFSRWLRAICTVLLSRSSQDDRNKAIGYVEQAIAVMEEYSDDQQDDVDNYPSDERQWLLGTSYNTAIECFHASLAEEAKRWFEAATVICRFTPDGKTRAAKISETYSHLLAQFARHEDHEATNNTDTL